MAPCELCVLSACDASCAVLTVEQDAGPRGICRVAPSGSKLTSCAVSRGAVEHDAGPCGIGRVAQSGDSVERGAGPCGDSSAVLSGDSVEQDAGPRGIDRVVQSS